MYCLLENKLFKINLIHIVINHKRVAIIREFTVDNDEETYMSNDIPDLQNRKYYQQLWIG